MTPVFSEPPTYSLVIPVFNEEETLPELYRRLIALMEKLDGSAEVVLVDDGSRDHSYKLMVEINERDPRFKIVKLARNFGHQIALTAGLDFACGAAIVIMDADLQDPPELVLEMAARWREGYEVVYGIREDRQEETWFKRTACTVFYRLMRRLTDVDIPVDVGDFRLADRKAVDAVKSLRENSRFLRGMFSWVGFRQIGIAYQRPGRFAGTTKYPLRKLMKLALDGVMSFSSIPLRMVLHLGLIISCLSFLVGIATVVTRLLGAYNLPGWASLFVAVSFLGGVQLVVLGIIGEYLARIYDEVRQRPLYVADQLHGLTPTNIRRVVVSTNGFAATPDTVANGTAVNGNAVVEVEAARVGTKS